MTTIAIEKPRQPDVLELVRLADEYALSLYPPEAYHKLDIADLERPGVTLFVARDDGLAGIVALVDNGDGSAEVKRMFVAEQLRGRGVASALLRHLADAAAAASISVIRLETGWKQPEAIALYLKHGYVHIPSFGAYVGDETSVCMEKRLG
jgi:GNAT superfamily N-acetyltransferase